MLYAAKTHIGLVRHMNQDGFSMPTETMPMRLFVIADGMGGASAGDVASRIAIDVVTQYVAATDEHSWANPPELLLAAVDAANRAICRTAANTPEYAGMGTTVVAVLADAAQFVVAHAGDSRLYGILGGSFQQLTQDHSLVAELVRRGQLTAVEAEHHPQRHIVTRSLGTAEFGFPDMATYDWRKGDVLLLCTDGLSNLATAVELETAMRTASQSVSAPQVESVVDSLLSLALHRGGHDNITAMLVVHAEAGDEA